MKSINWTVRIKNKTFWLAIIPLVLLLVQQIGAMCGVAFDFTVLNEQLLGLVNTIFAILVLVGVVTDPTTKGFGDSERALDYDEPAE